MPVAFTTTLSANELVPLFGDVRVRRSVWERLAFEAITGCWLWLGLSKWTVSGPYGRISVNNRSTYTHQFFYQLFGGQVPRGLELDHLCRNTLCCNPDHLEAVTHAENIRRSRSGEVTRRRHAKQTHCKRGHALTGDNVRMTHAHGYPLRACRACQQMHRRASDSRRRGTHVS
jgi:hypothetical protein